MKGHIWLYAAGGRELGLGNVVRTAALAEAFAQRGWGVRLFIYMDSGEIATPTLSSVAPEVIRDAQLFWKFMDEARLPPEVVVWDNRHLSSADVKRAKAYGVIRFVSINDKGEGRAVCDLLLDENERPGPPSLPQHFNGTFLHGAQFRIIRPEVVQLRPVCPREARKIRSVLVSCGGADPGMCTARLAAQLIGAAGADAFAFTIVIGPCFSSEHVEKIVSLTERNSHFHVEWHPRDLAQLMLGHDVFVGLGGVSAYESMCLGCPCLLVNWSFMREYVNGLVKRGWALGLGDVSQAGSLLVEAVRDSSGLHEAAARAWRGVDGRGCLRIVEAVERQLQEARC